MRATPSGFNPGRCDDLRAILSPATLPPPAEPGQRHLTLPTASTNATSSRRGTGIALVCDFEAEALNIGMTNSRIWPPWPSLPRHSPTDAPASRLPMPSARTVLRESSSSNATISLSAPGSAVDGPPLIMDLRAVRRALLMPAAEALPAARHMHRSLHVGGHRQ